MSPRSKPNGKPKPPAKSKPSGKSKPNGTSRSEKTVLVLQGGGALGSYQAGAYAELAAHDLMPDWVAGMSIGAINAAIIAGNPPERRVDRLRTFWGMVSSHLQAAPPIPDGQARSAFNETSASLVALYGAPGFFAPRLPSPLLFPPNTRGTLSLYETTPLKETLRELIDFDLINKGHVRLSVGAVNIRTGNFKYFDNTRCEIGPKHIMASGALPPGFPPVEINGHYYWDGGLVSNTPLQHVLDKGRQDMLIFQIDLFSARGLMPASLSDVAEREKDIRFSSRTRLNTDMYKVDQERRRALHRLLAKLPADLKDDPDARMLAQWSDDSAVTIVHLIKRRAAYSTEFKDFEFSRASMQDHWDEGVDEVQRSLANPKWIHRARPEKGVMTLDLTHDDELKLVPPDVMKDAEECYDTPRRSATTSNRKEQTL